MDDDHASSACLSETTIAGFLERRLPDSGVDAVEAHIDHCVICRLVLVELARTSPAAHALASHHATDVHVRTPDDGDILARGTVVGRFVVVDVLGAGGMGTVYAAYDPELDRNVAVKVLHRATAFESRARSGPPLHASGGAAPGALRDGCDGDPGLHGEAQAMARIQHANVVAVHEVGTFRDQVFIAMEQVDGVTLRRWMASAPRTWREVVTVFLHAGEGLAAAHQAGVVHRDFKPENVLVGADRRVRVSDFSIAATRPGSASFAGTPAYMAPEAVRSGAGDARSDQFSFCVAFHEALYGSRPFPSPGVHDFPDDARRGPRPQPRSARVPKQVRAVLRRGLAFDPEARYPSLRELLADLRRRLEVRRRVQLAAAAVGVIAVAVGATVVVALAHAGTAVPPCSRARDKLAGVWDEPHKLGARAAFLATALPYAAVSFERAAARLDHYTARWVTARTDACEASELRHEQSPALLDLRMACLDDRAVRLRVVVDAFVHADARTVRDAVAITETLPALAGCADPKALLAVVPPPDNPAIRARIDRLLGSVSEAGALLDTGKPQQASARVGAIDAEVSALDYAPLSARHAYLRARLASWDGEVLAARQRFKRAAAEAEAGGVDETKFRSQLKAAQFADAAGDGEDAERMLTEASATSRRLGMPRDLEADLAQGRGRVQHNAGNYLAALSHRRRALALGAELHGASDFHTANARIDVAETLRMLGRLQDAVVEAERAARDLDAALGADHPDAATAHAMRAMLRFDQGYYAEALAESDLAYRRLAAVLGPHHADLAGAATVAGHAQIALRHHDAGIDLLRRAVEFTEAAHEPTHPVVRGARISLAQGLLRARRARAAAVELTRLLEAPARAGAPHDALDGMALVGLCAALSLEGRARAAAARCEAGLRILDAQLGRRNVETAAALGELGHSIASFDVRRGLALLEEAVALEGELLGARDPRTAIDRIRLGKLLYRTGDRARGRRLVAEVHALLTQLGEALDSAELAGWLQRHPADSI